MGECRLRLKAQRLLTLRNGPVYVALVAERVRKDAAYCMVVGVAAHCLTTFFNREISALMHDPEINQWLNVARLDA